MLQGYTIFITYGFETDDYESTPLYGDLGYSSAIHCNYIQKLTTDNISNKNINFYFKSASNFPFLSGQNLNNGKGWSAKRIFAIAQYVNNNIFDNVNDIKPFPEQWRKFDVTNQINGYIANQTLSPSDLELVTFSINLGDYNTAPIYDLTYINYPINLPIDSNKLSFGEEQVFFGNVSTEIEAIAYSSDIAVSLPLNEFNSTTNLTWDRISAVQISEIGIYDNLGNLVAIGKLNNPISKNNSIARTIVLGLDF
jgi:hypothetical protein